MNNLEKFHMNNKLKLELKNLKEQAIKEWFNEAFNDMKGRKFNAQYTQEKLTEYDGMLCVEFKVITIDEKGKIDTGKELIRIDETN